MIDQDKAKKLGFEIVDSQKEQNPLYENLKSNFPQTINADGKPNLKAIATLLGISDKADMQGYELTFSGKGLANALYSTPCTKELFLNANQSIPRYFHTDSKDTTLSGNTILRGDNLDVLKLLKSAYSEKIKMIYIDPPYNTKNDNFIYPDDFRKDYQEILKEVGLLLEDKNGEWIESESLKFFKNITGSKSHSGWLSFMLPRLKLARDLLREDGVIFISIDDNEQANLKILCDEIFGEENFVSCFTWRRKTGASDAKGIANIAEYILCYIKDNSFIASSFNENVESYDEKRYKLSDKYIEKRGKYYIDNLDRGGIHYSDSLNYGIECPDGTITYPNGRKKFINEGWVWTWGKQKLKWGIENGFIEFRKSKTKESGWAVCYKNYLYVDNEDKIIQRAAAYKNLILDILNTHATTEIQEIFKNKVFDTPKPIKLIKHFLRLSTLSNTTSDLILDFFAGSGTTAQAVMELNAEDGGDRKFILVQIDEPINEEKSKIAYDFCKNELKSENPAISDITIERVKRAGEKIIKENPNFKGDVGFSVYSLRDKPSLVCDEEGRLKLLTKREGASPSDIARNLALQCGKGLDKELKCILESKLYKCEDVYCVVECDKEVLEILSDTKNEYIFIDGYADIKLEAFLNLKSNANINERLRIVY